MKKVNKILFAETLSKYYYLYQNWYFPLKRHCNEIISFDVRFNYFKYGKDQMNQMFLDLVKKEKPDIIFLAVRNEEFHLNTLLKIREISPKTRTTLYFGDDDTAFEAFSRYYMLFLNYGLIAQHKFLKEYKKEGINDVFFTIGVDTHYFRPLKLKKEYDVTFIGDPKSTKSERYEMLKFLKDNGIKINLFGWGWDNYKDFKDISGGALESDKMVETLNKSKINLCFSKNNFGVPQMKGKVFEGGACKTFVLTEYCDEYPSLFKEGKELITFRTKEEMLEKVNYFLKHEKEREKVAKAGYERIIKDYALDRDLDKIITNISRIKNKLLPRIKNKAISLSKSDIRLSLKEIKEKIKDFECVYFKTDNSEDLELREYLQSYSLEKTKKQISCCNYYVYSKLLGDYLYFWINGAYNLLEKKDFDYFLNLDQIMVTKDFFIKNLDKFKEVINGGEINFISKKNTAFISLPLVRIYNIKSKNYEIMKKAFIFNFLFQLISLKLQKSFFTLYPLALLLEILKGKWFILKSLYFSITDVDKRKKLDNIQKKDTTLATQE